MIHYSTIIMNKVELIEKIKIWINLDDDIRALQGELREKRKERKQNSESLVRVMRENDIDCFDLDSNGGKLIYTKRKIKKALSKKHLMTTLLKYFDNDKKQATNINTFIMDHREEKIEENIRRKIKK